MAEKSEHIVYPTDPDEKERLAAHVSGHKHSHKHLTLPCESCGQTNPHAVARLIEDDGLYYAVRCSNCGAVGRIVADDDVPPV